MSEIAEIHPHPQHRWIDSWSRWWTSRSRRDWRSLFRTLVPDEEENDPRFRAGLQRLSVIGLRVIAGVNFGGTIYFGAASILSPFTVTERVDPLYFTISIVALGAAALALSFASAAKPHARWIAIGVGYGVAITQFWSLRHFIEIPEAGQFILSGIVAGIMLVGIAAIPLKPVHVFALGSALTASFSFLLGVPGMLPHMAAEHTYRTQVASAVVLIELVLLCTALTAVVYHQRVLAYRGRRSARQAFEELRQAQVRVLVSENAASQSRFAAALSHELNTPLGSLASAFDTVVEVHRREKSCPESVEKLEAIFEEATRSGQLSTSRLRETVEHMKHLTNLDRAEEQVTDLNHLWKDTVALLSAEIERKGRVELELKSLPPTKCRPQQMGAVFSNLLRNAAAALEEDGLIQVTSGQRDGETVLEVRDNGCGMSRSQLKDLFEPKFRVDSGRVSTTNWGLFICRSIIAEHGGHLEVESEQGVGTTARILLPSPIQV